MVRIIFFCFLISHVLCAQNAQNQWLYTRQVKTDSVLNRIKKYRDPFLQKIKKEDPFVATELRKAYESRNKELGQMITEGYFAIDSTNNYLQALANRLCAASLFMSRDYTILVSKSIVPNASSRGEGILVVNSGLITKCASEEELVFVLAHEMAHDYLDHNYKAAVRNYKIYKDSKVKNEVRKALKAKYNKSGRAQSVIDNYLMKINLYSREDEVQADSLAHVLLTSAGYGVHGGLKSLKMLEHADTCLFNERLNLVRFFSDSAHPVNKKWLAITSPDKNIYRAQMNDSLRTHPECGDRIMKLINTFKIDTGNIANTNNNELDWYRHKSYFVSLDYLVQEENYLLALYYALHLKQHHPDNTYLTMVVCRSMYHIALALKRHEFSYHVPLPHPDFDSDLNYLIGFLNNLSFSDYKNLTALFYDRFSGAQADDFVKQAEVYKNCIGKSEEEIGKIVSDKRKTLNNNYFSDIEKSIKHEND